ncbi:MAG: DegQ family serine endoprotease [Bdellovibrionales bacterium]|nr:DegQ family serine endoprotease [Bdellovibrionales bacterium]
MKRSHRPLKLIIFGLLAFIALSGVAQAEDPEVWLEGNGHSTGVDLNLPSFAPIIKHLAGAVVNISTEGTETVNTIHGRRNPFGGPDDEEQLDSPFKYFFPPPGRQQERSFKTHSLGSGFVIHPDGYIVTNNHVVASATKIMVRFKDNKSPYRARVVGRDPKTDIALLKVDADEKLESVVFGNSDTLEAGDWVIAIGNPFRLGHTVTVGIVSALSRKVPGGGPYDDFIQTDASINPGNSGGPLFNARGEVVGVNTAIFSPGSLGSSGFNIGIGFAIPINLVKSIVTQLHDHGKVVRGWLGVLIQPVTPEIADAMQLKNARGALIADVVPESPAAKAGLRRGDVIVRFDGKEVEENSDLPLMVAETEIGREVDVVVLRSGKLKTIGVTIQELEETEVEVQPNGAEESLLGLTVQDVTPELAESLGLENSDGVLVAQVAPDSVAEEAGLLPRDIILEVGSEQIRSAKQFNQVLKELKSDKPVLFLIRRGDNTLYVPVTLE